MSLYRRVRPTSLDEIVGNDSVIAGLKRWLKDPNRNHAIHCKDSGQGAWCR